MSTVVEQYEELSAKLESLIGAFEFSADINMRLERIECLLGLLGNPQESFSIIHVGGTSGKGSTSSYITNILKCDGYRVGTFLSPYLQIINEVCLINGCPAKTSDLLDEYREIEKTFVAVAEKTGFGRPSYFEVKFALSLMLFKRKNIDVAVVEVGLGGTLDATNVLTTEVSVLVSVGLDHIAILGNTIEEIACDKVGIIKDNGILVCGFTQETTRSIASRKAAEKKAKLLLINRDFRYTYCDKKLSIKTDDFCSHAIDLPLAGDHQAHNATCAVVAYSEFTRLHDRKFSAEAVREGLNRTRIPGRGEVVQKRPLVILDGAHNPDKLKAFFSTLEGLTSAPIVVVALKGGRDLNREIFPLFRDLGAKHIIATAFYPKGIWKSLTAGEMKHRLENHYGKSPPVTAIQDPLDAIGFAIDMADEADVIIVTGSLFLVGNIREYWYPKQEILEDSECGRAA